MAECHRGGSGGGHVSLGGVWGIIFIVGRINESQAWGTEVGSRVAIGKSASEGIGVREADLRDLSMVSLRGSTDPR